MKMVIMAVLLITTAAGVRDQGVIKDITGTVEVKKSGQADFVPAKEGESVDKNTVISAGFKSAATVVAGGAAIFIRPLTRLTLEELIQGQGSEQAAVSLQTGRVKVEVKPPPGTKTDFTVKSPSATASVRGTAFEFDAYSVSVSEGTVAYYGGKGKPVLVSEGGSSSVNPAKGGGRAADPVETAVANLTPPAPAGAEAASAVEESSAVSIPVASSTGLTINLQFE